MKTSLIENGKLKVENEKQDQKLRSRADCGRLRVMSYKKGSLVEDKSYAFALRIIKLYKFLIADCEYVLSKQVLRSGTSIGAMVKEAEHAQSKADFIHKMSIALKEANETEYWLMLLKDSDYIDRKSYNSIQSEASELIKLLASIVKSSKKNL